MAITNASRTVKGIFSLHVITAGASFLLMLAAIGLFVKQLAGGPGRPRAFMKFWQSTGKRHSAAGTQFFVISGLFCLMVAYAAQSAIVALQSRLAISPFYVTSSYAYPHYPGAFAYNPDMRYGKSISILSFLYQCAMILMNTSIVGAIWIYANHIHSNGTHLREPGFLSMVLNSFWMLAILGLGFASWAVGMARRGSGNSALAYPSQIGSDYIVRTLYVVYLSVVIGASTSVTIEGILCWLGIKKNGLPGNKFQSALTRLVMLITPLVWMRNAFYIADLIIIYRNARGWSQTTNQALAFLFIIFGQLCDLGILALLLLGAWSFGRKDEVAYVVKDARYSESVANRDSVVADSNNHYINNNVNNGYNGHNGVNDVNNGGPAYVPHVTV